MSQSEFKLAQLGGERPMSKHLRSVMTEAIRAESQGNFQTANRLYGEVLAIDPSNREAFLYHSLTLVALGKAQQAVAQLERFVSLDPKCVLALNWLAKLHRDSGRIEAALIHSEKAVQVNPDDVEALYNLGLCFLGLNRFEEAISCFERSTEIEGRFGPGYYALSCAYEAIGQPWQALLAIKNNVQIDPYPPGFLKLAQLYLAVGDSFNAIEFGLKALDAAPNPAVHSVLAEAYADSNPDLARTHYEAAIELDPKLDTVLENNRAKRLSRLGRLDEAREINVELRDREPASGTAYLNWVTIKRIDQGDSPVLERMEGLLEQPTLGWEDKCALHYALGKSFDDLGDYEKAIGHYDEANDLKFAYVPYLGSFDPDALSNRIDRLIEMFTPQVLRADSNIANESNRPIFIVGMMRTGTTLMEQILGRHPRVAAGGELAHWPYSTKKIIDFHTAQISHQNLLTCTESYLELLETISSDADRVTDKNPANLLEVGLIHLAFPRAHIIQMARDPIDTAISIYITPTRRPPDFSCDRENIVFAMQQTQRLAQHWRDVIPKERYHVVQYENLVSEPESVIRTVLAQCELEATEVAPGASQDRPMIGTPSLWQARQPITKAAVGRSKRYGPWLGEFKNLA